MLWRNWPENGDYKLNKRTSGVLYVNIRMFCVCLILLLFFLVTRGVWASFRAPQLIPGSTEHPASPVDR
jgi:hypothetical protein